MLVIALLKFYKMGKNCFYCKSKITTKKGFLKGLQRYKCAVCGKTFTDRVALNGKVLWKKYTKGKQTYLQLSQKYGCSVKTIQRKLVAVELVTEITFSSVANMLVDTTYFGRTFGVMVFKKSINGQIFFKQYVRQETTKLYLLGTEEIAGRGIKISTIMCDGRKGLFQQFGADMLIQMCNFYQIAIIRRYLTMNPKMQASLELWKVSSLLTKTCKEIFEARLQVWYNLLKHFLSEPRIDEKGKKKYV